MLLYDNRSWLRLLLQVNGSVYKRCWLPLILIVSYCVSLHAVLITFPNILPPMDHPFAAQTFGTLVAFAVCFRTNIAWSRFWESVRESNTMFSKWGDAYMQLQGFINCTIASKPDMRERLEHERLELAHYMSLLSAMAVERLTRGDIRRMEMRRRKGVAWKDQIVFRETLRANDLTGSRNLIPIKTANISKFAQRSTIQAQAAIMSVRTNEAGPSSTKSTKSLFGERVFTNKATTPRRRCLKESMTQMQLSIQYMKDHWDMPVTVVGAVGQQEFKELTNSHHRVHLVLAWINEHVAKLQKLLDTPPPILSRVFQELSNGALGYSHAEKLSDIPFPFVFAQLLALQVSLFAGIAPVIFTLLTGFTWMTPFISSIVVMCFWTLNEIAKELENPFGNEANNVPMIDTHESFVEFLLELHGQRCPPERAYVAPEDRMRFTEWSSGSTSQLDLSEPTKGKSVTLNTVPDASPGASSASDGVSDGEGALDSDAASVEECFFPAVPAAQADVLLTRWQ